LVSFCSCSFELVHTSSFSHQNSSFLQPRTSPNKPNLKAKPHKESKPTLSLKNFFPPKLNSIFSASLDYQHHTFIIKIIFTLCFCCLAEISKQVRIQESFKYSRNIILTSPNSFHNLWLSLPLSTNQEIQHSRQQPLLEPSRIQPNHVQPRKPSITHEDSQLVQILTSKKVL